MERFKFEMIRATEGDEMTYQVSTRFSALAANEIVGAFVDFVSGCGFHKDSIIESFEEYARQNE
jgi:hypothetical protein